MKPEYIRALRSDANFVQERNERYKLMEALERKQQFEEAERWFTKKYPHYNWRDWAEKKKGMEL